MKIYTKTGDKGKTSLYDGSRVSKTHQILQTVGEIDELTSRIGFMISLDENDVHISELRDIQRNLQDINSHIATVEKKNRKLPNLGKLLDNTASLETRIDCMERHLPKLTKFILPGVTPMDAQSHLCRTQTRKVERFLNEEEIMTILGENSQLVLSYINRLSDFFFVLARFTCYNQNKNDYFA